MAGLVYRQNNVPKFQAIFQKNDGIRLWNKGPRAKMLLYPYYAMLLTGFAGAMYGTGRAIAGKKTFFGAK